MQTYCARCTNERWSDVLLSARACPRADWRWRPNRRQSVAPTPQILPDSGPRPPPAFLSHNHHHHSFAPSSLPRTMSGAAASAAGSKFQAFMNHPAGESTRLAKNAQPSPRRAWSRTVLPRIPHISLGLNIRVRMPLLARPLTTTIYIFASPVSLSYFCEQDADEHVFFCRLLGRPSPLVNRDAVTLPIPNFRTTMHCPSRTKQQARRRSFSGLQ